MVEALAELNLEDSYFDAEVYDKVADAKRDLLMKANVEAALLILSSTNVNSFILEMTGIEKTIRNVAVDFRPAIRPICGYILRKWDRQKRDQAWIKPRLLITPSRPEKKLKITFDSSDFIFLAMKEKKMIHWNKKGGVRSLQDLCRRQIQSHIHVAVKRKRITSLYDLIRKTTKGQLELMEEKLLAVAEISDMLWEAMLYYHFRGHNVPLAMTNKEAFNYLWTRRTEFEEEESSKVQQRTILSISLKPVVRKLLNRLVMYLAEIFV